MSNRPPMTSAQFAEQFRFAKEMMADWPEWKRNILVHSLSPTSKRREPVSDTTTPSDPAKHAEAVRREAEHLHRVFYEDGYLPAGETAKKLFEAAAYLDSLPGDGNEPATVDWLEGQGVPGYHSAVRGIAGLQYAIQADGAIVLWFAIDKLAIPSELAYTPTRSQVRHLLAALTPLTPATGGE